jgi:translocation and assembly module TamA
LLKWTGTALAGVLAALAAQPLAAQDTQAPPTLEELIPDSALDDPESWAEDLSETEQERADDLIALDPQSPLDPIPGLDLAWPDEIDLPEFQPVDPDPQYAYDPQDPGLLAPAPDGAPERISDELLLVFPSETSLFPQREEFIERFASLSTIEELDSDEDNLAQLAAQARADEELLTEMLRVYGYYDATVMRNVSGPDAGEDRADTRPQVTFGITPNAQYTYGAINLGDLPSAPDAAALRDAFEIAVGDPVLQDKVVEEQADLDVALGETGYPFAAIDAPELLIDHARTQADLTMLVSPNGKYNFAGVESSLPDFLSSRHLGDIARFEPGDLYQRSDELDLRRAILATGLVSSVTITPREVRAPTADAPGEVMMDVGLTPAPLRTLAGSIGYGTGEGFRLEGSWEHRNLFPPEGLLRVRGIAGTREQLAGVTFRKNNWRGRDRILTLDLYASALDNDAFEANTVAFIANYERISTLLFQKPLTWAVGVEVLATDEREAVSDDIEVKPPRQTYFVGALPARAQIDTSDDLLDPTRGWRLGGFLSPEISHTNDTESFYLRTQVDGTYYQPFGFDEDGENPRVVMAGRVRLASIPGAPLNAIAPSRRLYAGGGGSVRGYGYQAIGPRDELGQPSGGRSLVEASVEARIRTGLLGGAVSVVPFVDAGSVGPNPTPDLDEIKVGVGVGARYHTGFGPIRLDVGVPLNRGPDDGWVAVYVSLGQAF